MKDVEYRLADGSLPVGPDELFGLFDELGIVVGTVEHEPIWTVAESLERWGELSGAHTKNLLLSTKKGRLVLYSCRASQAVNLKALAAALAASRFSFASPERLMEVLGVRPGAVSPLALINDHGRLVEMIVEHALLGEEPLNFHPLANTMTTSITSGDLVRFLEAIDHPPVLVDLD